MKTETNNKIRQFDQVLEIIQKHKYQKTRLITILQEVQEVYRFLPQEVLTYVATALDMPVAEVYGVATFYAHFSLEAKGKYVIKVCDGTACHVRGSSKLLDTLRSQLKLNKEKHTTDDMLFTIEAVSCLGACGLAPVMVINEQVYGEVNSARCSEILKQIIEKETEMASAS
ncbi:MAG: NAD(P)H-dependent oxidoreductase subunit E [Bacteroidales bacterium]|jgi:NADH-quinone oxidoreductase subunit E|nr:NAD(P)H-dependent oxidoreductase subunit E [Bacteroidales bacterium]MDD4088025.1 NAD(P)H-dependent oxidoreductase subunit E [Bacteroidales bacterium]MDY0086015.1 NAD(P)H-dependent oxidoreductase subunit E [Bacteroidales bacterium]